MLASLSGSSSIAVLYLLILEQAIILDIRIALLGTIIDDPLD